MTTPYMPKVFLYGQICRPRWPVKTTDLAGQTAIVTGANRGIGSETAAQLLSYNLSHLIITARSQQQGEAAAARLRSRYPNARVQVWTLDMTSYDSITGFVRHAREELDRLDMVILNAGIWWRTFRVLPSTKHEEMLQVNGISTVLLIILMLPILKSKSPAGSPGRLTISTAGLTHVAKLPDLTTDDNSLFVHMDNSANFEMLNQYAISKLLACMAVWKIADYVSADDVIVNLADPGYVYGTTLMRDVGSISRVLAAPVGSILGRSHKAGASTYLDGAVVKGKDSHGSYLMNWKISAWVRPPMHSFLGDLADRRP
jgi:NAD(P)-dependent dehydrogenase (short-subunit alcohol dehydrogenase family)